MSTERVKGLGKVLLVTIASLAVVLGVGLFSAPKVSANGNDGSVTIGSTSYGVNHDGKGAYVMVKGVKYYLNGNTVVISGKTYYISSYEHHHRHHHEHGDHHDHHEHHHNHHHDHGDHHHHNHH